MELLSIKSLGSSFFSCLVLSLYFFVALSVTWMMLRKPLRSFAMKLEKTLESFAMKCTTLVSRLRGSRSATGTVASQIMTRIPITIRHPYGPA